MSNKVYSSCENEKDETDQTQTMYIWIIERLMEVLIQLQPLYVCHSSFIDTKYIFSEWHKNCSL